MLNLFTSSYRLLGIKITLFLLICMGFTHLQAQKLSLQAQGGVIIGSPFGSIPEGATGSPGVGPYAGVAIAYHLNDRFSIRIEGNFAQKGSKYNAPIAGRTRVERSIFGLSFEIPFNLSYEGVADGMYDNEYIDIPLSFVYHNRGGRFAFLLGPYASYLLEGIHTGTVNVRVSRLFNVNDEPFDQSELMREWDYGAHAGVEFKLYKGLYVMADAMVGLVSVFSENPEGLEGTYRNIYMRTGIAYRIGKN